MTWILEGAAVLCLVYYGVIVSYSGMGTSFALIWPVLAVLFGLAAAAFHYYRKFPGQVPMWLTVPVATAASAFIAVFILVELLISLGALTSTKLSVDYVIVLGAKVNGMEISKSLKKRLDKALKYAENNPNTMLVLSGGQGEDEDISEAQAMYEYLLFNGMTKEQLLLEDKSVNTRQNIVFSKEVIGRHEKWKSMVGRESLKDSYKERDKGDIKVAVLTNNFHVFRAKEIAKKQDIGNVYGISASCDPVLAVHYWVRECFAVLKDKFMGAM